MSGWRSKDLFDTAGVRTTYGSAIFAEHVPSTTAAAVARLQAAGYTSVGKANLHEFAWGITSENQHSGGSIRIPAACCGVTGFKPTFGLVPLAGCFPLAPSFDHAGPMARDVAGCETIMRALVPGFAAAPLGQLDDLEVAIAWTDAADPLVRDRVQRAAALFSRSRTVELPFPDGTGPAFSREAAEVHAELWREHHDLYGMNVAHKLQRAMHVSDAEASAALGARQRYRERLAELMSNVDLVVTPTLATIAPVGRHQRACVARTDAEIHVSVERDRRARAGHAVRSGRMRDASVDPARRAPRRRPARARSGIDARTCACRKPLPGTLNADPAATRAGRLRALADRDTPVQPVGADETRHAAAPVTGLLLRGGAEVPRE